eukprot:TRINITY_DN59653_c0_g1_i1.p1 TRINITY_DN59653_c0_g1~~TRINITY_DN59653_c0_g1_i1.p1  ORF type:complete len:228 (-),score=37.13 TRINITY_DN59653_c0_g1_i1:187-804(-)
MSVHRAAQRPARRSRKLPRSRGVARVFLATVGCMAVQNSLMFTARTPTATSIKGIGHSQVHRVTGHVAVGEAGYPHSVLTAVSQEQNKSWNAPFAKSIIAMFVTAWGAIEVLGTFRCWRDVGMLGGTSGMTEVVGIADAEAMLLDGQTAAAAVGAGGASVVAAAACGATGAANVAGVTETAAVAMASEAEAIAAMRNYLERHVKD